MYAIVADGGRQYKVEVKQILNLDYRDVAAGETLQLDRVLLVSGDGSLKIGKPTVEGAKVEVKVVGTKLGDKIFIQKFRRRKNYRRRTGHRQQYTQVEILSIHAG
jgi:large subunit ribosomal protein L21